MGIVGFLTPALVVGWRYLSSYPDAEHDVVWLAEKLGERNARIAELEARLRRNEWILLLP